VRHVETTPRGTTLRLFDGTEEPLDPSSVTVSEDGILYARVKGGRFEARLAPAAHKEMVDILEEGPDGAPLVRIASSVHPVRERPRTGLATH